MLNDKLPEIMNWMNGILIIVHLLIRSFTVLQVRLTRRKKSSFERLLRQWRLITIALIIYFMMSIFYTDANTSLWYLLFIDVIPLIAYKLTDLNQKNITK